jgi:hypothetical protein
MNSITAASGLIRVLFFSVGIVLPLLLSGCASKKSNVKYDAYFERLTPGRWQQPGTWRFEIVDDQQQSLGHILLLLSGINIDSGDCVDEDWKKAVVLVDTLDIDYGFDISPAYSIRGRWLTIDLTASVCDADYKLIGQLDDENAAGNFNYAHLLGGYNIGTFTASPVGE